MRTNVVNRVIGQRFGRLIVLEESEKGFPYVTCRCDCGNTKDINAYCLTGKYTTSCGCYHKERAKEIGAKNIIQNAKGQLELKRIYKTNFGVIETKNPPRNNKSGHKGVWYDPKRNQYETYINLNHKKILIGRFSTYDEAVTQRKLAEEQYYKPLIEQKNSQKLQEI